MYPHPSSPTADPSDPFGSSSFPRRYIYSDNDSDNADPYGRRDTFTSDSSHHGLNDDRYYDNNGPYDLYGRLRPSFAFCIFTSIFSLQDNKTPIRTLTMARGTPLRSSHWAHHAWACPRPEHHTRTTVLANPRERRTQLGHPSVKFPSPKKKSRIFSLTSHRSLVFNGTPCGIWSVPHGCRPLIHVLTRRLAPV